MRVLDARGLTPEGAAAKLARNRGSMDRALAAAREIVGQVEAKGDDALLAYAERFDGVRPAKLLLGRADLEAALARIPKALRDALAFAARQIDSFHKEQSPVGYEVPIGSGGSRAGQAPRAIDRAGVYVPGGPRGYPSSVLMGVLPARIAGVREILVATPPSKVTGLPPEAVLAAAAIAGADEVLVAGGAQAVAAMAVGTRTVRPVDKIVGPGNVYVTAAKLLLQDRVATDGIAGPSEVCVIADETLPTDVLAAELLAQAEHDADAVVVGIIVDGRSPDTVEAATRDGAKGLPRAEPIREALDRNGVLVQAESVSQALAIAEALAPEHLVLAVRDARAYLDGIRNAGCVFLGRWSAAPMGDYTIGTNHVLPTAGTARWRGALSVRDFVKFVSYVVVVPEDLDAFVAPAAEIARAEGFDAHAAALEVRRLLFQEASK